MRKSLLAILFISLFAVFLLPQAVSAQGPLGCCGLKTDIRWTKTIRIDNATRSCAEAKPCVFKEGKAVGETIGVNQCGHEGTAAETTKCTDADAFTDDGTQHTQRKDCLAPNEWGMICLLNTLYGVTNWIFAALVAVAGILVILGAFNIVTAGGSSDKVASGRNYIIYAAVGLAVGLLARAIPAIVRMIVGA